MKLKATAAILALAYPAVAQAMPTDIFLAKSAALEANGFTAMFSSDFKLLMDVIKADAAALKAENLAAKAARRMPAFCPLGPFKLSTGQIIEAMRAVPVSARSRTDSQDALRAYFAKRFPCPTGH